MSRTAFPHGTRLPEAVSALMRGVSLEEVRDSASRVRQDSSRSKDAAIRQVAYQPDSVERIQAAAVSGGLSR